MEVKSEANGINMVTLACYAEQSKEVSALFNALHGAMYSVCFMQNKDICGLIEEHELTKGESLLEAVVFVLADRLYNVCKARNVATTEHDCSGPNEMKTMVAFCSNVQKPRAHGPHICMALRFGQWYRVMVKEVALIGVSPLSGDGHTESPLFEVTSIPYYYTRAVRTCNWNPPVRKLHITNVCEKATPFYRCAETCTGS